MTQIESTKTYDTPREKEFASLAEPARAWRAHEEIALHEVLAAVLTMKEKGLLKAGARLSLDEEDQELLAFCRFADKHFLSEDTRA